MLQMFQCFNCCGQRIESVAYEEICPNCGGLMALPRWNLDELLIASGSAARAWHNDAEFISIGSLLSDELFLLSYAMNQTYAERALEKRNLAALFVRPDDVRDIGAWPKSVTAIYSKCPRVDFFLFHNWLIVNTEFYGKKIGADYSHFKIGPISLDAAISNAVIESGVTISPGAVIGVDGARLIRKPDGTFFRVLHGGSVHIGEGAFIGANAVIVRSVWRKPTTIGAGAFVGNLVNVGHNVQIAPGAIVLPGAILCGHSEIASTGRIGAGVMVANGVRVAGTANLGAVVTQDVPEGVAVSGNFAVEHNLQMGHTKRVASGLHADQMPILR